jgi:hypothetical protein
MYFNKLPLILRCKKYNKLVMEAEKGLAWWGPLV